MVVIPMIGIAILFICCYMTIRNCAVYSYRMNIIVDESLPWDERERRLYAIPTYNQMVLQLFTFNWDHYWNGEVAKERP